MTAANWQAFYTAQLGAAATLLGLVFVGLSINLKTILSYAWLPSRALLALMVLMAILIVASVTLMPGQSDMQLGREVLTIGLIFFAISSGMEVYALSRGNMQHLGRFVGNLILLGLGILPYIVGGVLLALGLASGFYWIAGAASSSASSRHC